MDKSAKGEAVGASALARKATAWHEAGHAVIGRKLNLACGEATIVADEDSLGGAIVGNPLKTWEKGDGPRRALVDAFCIALFAGAAAERLVVQEPHCGDGMDGDRLPMY